MSPKSVRDRLTSHLHGGYVVASCVYVVSRASALSRNSSSFASFVGGMLSNSLVADAYRSLYLSWILHLVPAWRSKSRVRGSRPGKTASKPGPRGCNLKVTRGLRATVVENGVKETYSARYYNPATGCFMSRDPLDGKSIDPNSLHNYLYAGGDPFRGGSEEHGFVLPGQLLPLSENRPEADRPRIRTCECILPAIRRPSGGYFSITDGCRRFGDNRAQPKS